MDGSDLIPLVGIRLPPIPMALMVVMNVLPLVMPLPREARIYLFGAKTYYDYEKRPRLVYFPFYTTFYYYEYFNP